MCGIVGYVGSRNCSEILLTGLQNLEYRGYDSAGLAIGDADGHVQTRRVEGKLDALVEAYESEPFDGPIGVGHTRWATHGKPSRTNAHPHRAGDVVVVHNGIVENYAALKSELRDAGRTFESETDTEVVAHLIDRALEHGADSLHNATRQALERLEGSYALVVMFADDPEELVVARNASPMVLSHTDEETFAASDIPAVLEHTRDFVFLEDGDTAVLKTDGIEIFDADGEPVQRTEKHIDWDPISAEKQGYKHFMFKEIHEQPARVIDALQGRVDQETGDVRFPELDLTPEAVRDVDKIVMLACGTSHFAAELGKYAIESLARVPVESDYAHEFRYRNPVLSDDTLCIPISQSGETADTLAAMKEADRRGASTLGIVNVIESTIAREADDVLYTHAGPEIGVASTKAFTTQLATINAFALWLGRRRGTVEPERARDLIAEMRQLPNKMEQVLNVTEPYEYIAREYSDADSFLYLGRGNQFPIAAEGALKLKEISYIHAEGYAAGEMKHGPIALIDEHLPVVVIAPQSGVYDKMVSNLEEVKARKGPVIAIATEGDDRIREFADVTIDIPESDEFVQPMLSVVAAQLLAYHVADFKGTDIDQPRNLAKSVTVE
ncbi:MAG: glutamine--fructose-6-phosphate transaminase (isomerizing) [Bradymonadaceae bacterium]